jgi:hypothetical protein
VTGNSQIGRNSTVARKTPIVATAIVMAESGLSERSSRIHRVCRPISRKTVFSSRNWKVRQLVRSDIRDAADWMIGAL